MTAASVEYVVQIQILLLALVSSEYCPGHGSVCPPPQRCCHGGSMCCTPTDQKSREPVDVQSYDNNDLQFGVWNLWYFWFIVIFLFMACTGACAFWRHRRRLLMAEQAALTTVSFGTLVPPRRYHCPPSQLSSEPSHGSLNRFSYFSTVLASSPSTQEPQGEFPSPPPYSEIGTKSLAVSRNSCWTDLPPYPGGFDVNIQQSQTAAGYVKDEELMPYRSMSSLPTSPPSYSVLSSTAAPPVYTVTPSRNRSSGSSLNSTPSVDSGEELIPASTILTSPP